MESYLKSKQKAEKILEKWDPKSWDLQPWLNYLNLLLGEIDPEQSEAEKSLSAIKQHLHCSELLVNQINPMKPNLPCFKRELSEDRLLFGVKCHLLAASILEGEREKINPNYFVDVLTELNNKAIVKKGLEFLKELAAWYLENNGKEVWCIIEYSIRENSSSFRSIKYKEIFDLFGPTNEIYECFLQQVPVDPTMANFSTFMFCKNEYIDLYGEYEPFFEL